MKTLLTRITALVGLAAALGIAFSDAGDSFRGSFDLRAAILVFAAPLLVLVLFGKSAPRVLLAISRIRSTRGQEPAALAGELASHTAASRGAYGFSHVARMSESHPDPMVRYAGGLYGARYDADELSRLLAQRMQAEDAEWQALVSAVAFLAKMAPYFGMLATVIGMIKLLENMSDFTRISGSMALAMQGTLYGLVSFTLLYSPLQRYLSDCREQWLKRGEIVARWFVMLSEQTDPQFMLNDLEAQGAPQVRAQGTAAATVGSTT